MQDFEFTVDAGCLYFLQTRAGKRTPWAALRIAIDLVREQRLTPADAWQRLRSYDLASISRTAVRARPGDTPLAHATPASVGVAVGALAFSAERAQALAASQPVVLARTELATEDLAGLSAATGVVTTLGGRTSHAAVVARQLGKVCLVGCADLRVDEAARECVLGVRRLREGDIVTLDGETGFIYEGHVPVVTERPDAELAAVARWAEQPAPAV
jgi:pyruvate,orthophosphate dikinase